MKILFIVPYVPSLVRVRPFNLIRTLAKRGHQVTLATLVFGPSDLADLESVRPFCRQIFSFRMPKWRPFYNAGLALASPRPLQADYAWQPAFASQITNHVRAHLSTSAYDVVHVEHLRGARYGLAMLDEKATDPNWPAVVWDSVDCISYLFRQSAAKSKDTLSRLWTRFELPRTESYESQLSGRFNRVLVTSSLDREAFLALPGQDHRPVPIEVLPNGVDLDYFQPGNGQRAPATLVVSGKMSYHANVTMTLFLVNEVMPLVWMRNPNVQLKIVGKNPPREILALGDLPCVEVTGTVADISSYLRKSAIAVAPIQYSAGIQNKVLEAMATATPVVTTRQGIAALSVQPGRDLLVADQPAEFAEKVLELLDRPEERQRIGRAGREFVETHYQWDQIVAQLETIYRQAIDSKVLL